LIIVVSVFFLILFASLRRCFTTYKNVYEDKTKSAVQQRASYHGPHPKEKPYLSGDIVEFKLTVRSDLQMKRMTELEKKFYSF